MNQILVTEKLYITTELKRKKNIYKIVFVISILAIIALISIFAYAEYDKTKNEDISKDLLSEMAETNTQNTVTNEDDDVWKIIVDTAEKNNQEQGDEQYGIYLASDGKKYKTVGSVKIPKINVDYPILYNTTVELLKIAPCKFFGPNPNQVGNLCIAGHNYKNSQFFSKADKLVKGDVIEITDLNNKTVKYSVYDKYRVVPEDTSCTSQYTNGKKIVTLITCTNDNKKRIIIQAKEIE